MTSTADDLMLDEEWLAAPRQRSRLRLVMVAALIASVCFLGGALVQKHFGVDDAAAATGTVGLPAGMPEGFDPGAGGGFPGADQQGAGTPSTEPEGGAAQEKVIGTVVAKNGDVWVVKDLGGTRHEVTITDDTTLVRESKLTRSQVKAGDSVQVTGTDRDDRLQATDITLR